MNTKTVKALALSAVLMGTGVAFAEDAYIESDGTQAVNLGYFASENTKIVIDFQITEWGTARAVFGPVYNDSGMSSSLWINGTGDGGLEPKMGDKWGGGFTIPTDKLSRFRVVWDGPAKKVHLYGAGDETPISTRDCSACTATGVSNRPLTLFASPNSASGAACSYYGKSRFYSMQIYENDELVRDYVPCRKGTHLGVFETKSSAFYEASAPLAAGGDIMEVEDDPYVASPNGGVVIDTGYHCGEKTRLECDYEITDDTVSDLFLFSAGYGKNFEVRGYIGTSGSGAKVINYGFSTNHVNTSTSVEVGKGLRRTLTIDGANRSASLATGITTNYSAALPQPYAGTSTDTLRLFCMCSEGVSKCIKMKLYGFRIYEDGVLVHDYRPALIGGVAVLADAVGGSWIKSKTTTELTGGGAIAERNDAYLESDGTQGVNLGYKVKTTSRIEVDFQFMASGDGVNINCVLGGGMSVSSDKNPLRFGIVRNAGGNFELCFPWGSSVWSGSLAKGDLKRHVAVIDIPARKGTVTSFASAEGSKTSTADIAADSEYPLGLFGTSNDTTGEKFYTSYSAAVRVYDVKAYESNVLVKHWVPYVKNGEVGLLEKVDGVFVSCYNGRRKLPKAGGEIGYDSCPPYIETDGNQQVLLDAVLSATARVEVDYAICETNKSQAVFGTYTKSKNYLMLWMNALAYSESQLGGKWSGSIVTDDLFARTLAVLDQQKLSTTLYCNDKTYVKTPADAAVKSAHGNPLMLFAEYDGPGAKLYYPGIKAKVFSLRVFEGEELAHEYLPYKKDGEVGLIDTQTGNFFGKYNPSGSDLALGGIGGDFIEEPADVRIPIGESATLTCGASGAQSYKWFRNGEEIAGETGNTLTVDWRRSRKPDVITVRAVYQLYGQTVLGEPSSATVTNEPLGACLIIR